MGQKIYIDGTTKELIVMSADETTTRAYPGFSELSRSKDEGNGRVIVSSMHGGPSPVNSVHFSDAENEAGDVYADLTAFWDALTPYFTTS